jgi:hypothetical protein
MAMLKQINDTVMPKPEAPLPLVMPKPAAPFYPLDALGDILGKAAITITECVQCPRDMAGQSVLAAASLAVQGLADVTIDGRTYPLSLFCLTVAGSGDRKSAADSVALKAHNDLQQEWMKDYLQDFEHYNHEKDSYDIECKKIKGNKKLTQQERVEALVAIPKPAELELPQLISQEPTLEGLQKSFGSGRASQGLFNDEGGQFFGGHAMNRDNALKSMAGLSKFWDGAPIIRTRAGDGESMALYGQRLCVHLMVQPIVAGTVLNDPVLNGQGFLPRFLLSWSDSIAGTRLYNHKDATQEPAIVEYWKVMRELLSKLLPEEGEALRQIGLTVEAKAFWVKAYDGIEVSLHKDGELADIKATASKAAENIARIAGVLALVDNVGAFEIELRHIKQAVILGQYYLNESVRLNETGPQVDALNNTQILLSWMQKKEHRIFSLRQIYQTGPRPSGARKSKSAAQKLINTLIDYKWLDTLPDGAEIDGVHHNDAWKLRNV